MLRETAPNLVKKCCLETSMEVRGRQKELHAKLKRSQRKEKQNILTLICVPVYFHSISSVQFSRSAVSLCNPMNWGLHTRPPCPSPTPITNSRSSPKFTSIESGMPFSHFILCRLLLPPIPPSIRVFSNESTLRMTWPKYWSFSFSIIPSKEHPGLISFRMD